MGLRCLRGKMGDTSVGLYELLLLTGRDGDIDAIFTTLRAVLWAFTVCRVICEGFRPERYISSMIYSRDIPFWSETLVI